MLVATGLMLAAFRYDLDWLIRLLLVGVSVMISWYVFAELVPAIVGTFVSDGSQTPSRSSPHWPSARPCCGIPSGTSSTARGW